MTPFDHNIVGLIRRRWKEEAIQEWRKAWDAAGRPGRPGQSIAQATAEWIKERQP